MPHRPVTMAFREVFQKLLNEETDWSAPDGTRRSLWLRRCRRRPRPRQEAVLVHKPSRRYRRAVPRLGRSQGPDHPVVCARLFDLPTGIVLHHHRRSDAAERGREFRRRGAGARGIGQFTIWRAEGARQYGHRARAARLISPSRPVRRSWSTASAQRHARATIPCAWTKSLRCRAGSDPLSLIQRRRSSSLAGAAVGPLAQLAACPKQALG